MSSETKSAVHVQSSAAPWRQLIESGDIDHALSLLEKCLDADPSDASALHDFGVVLARSNKLVEAIEKFEAAIRIDPSRSDVYGNLARACKDVGRLDEAEQWLIKATENKSESVQAHRALADFYRKAERHDDAAKAFQKAVALDPGSAELRHDLARSLVELKRRQEAKAEYLKAIELDPNFAEGLNNLGLLCQDMGDTDEAVKYLKEAIRLRPGVVGAYNNLGVAYNEQRKFDEAIDSYNKAVAIEPDYPIAWNNLGNALRAAGKVDAGISALEKAIRLQPDYPEVYNNLAIAYVQKADHEKAMECYNKALCFRPDYPECHMNRGLEWLLLGDMENGWADYEWRWQLKTLRSRGFTKPRWDGSPLLGKRVLLHYEQGLGDTIQFVRYAAELKQRGATVIFEGQRVLRHILARTPGLDEFVARGDTLPPFDVHSPLLSLPAIFQTTLRNIPSNVPYIFPDAHFVNLWEPRLQALKGLRIGIAWQGNPEHRGDHMRSIPLPMFESIAQVPGIRLISLQRNFGSEQVGQLNGRFEVTTFEGIDEDTDGFLRTAAIIQNLDLVIAADTGVAHLAAAMGKPVWIAIAVACDWRWLRDREDSPWYPTIRLFRQTQAGNWNEVFDRIVAAVRERTDAVGNETVRHVKPTPASKRKTDDQLRKAAECIGKDELEQAQQILEEVLQADPTRSEAHHDLGVVFGRRRKVNEAIACFRRALELKPDSVGVYGNLGLAFLQRGQFEEAIAHLQKAIRLGGGSAEVHNNLGLALLRSGDPAAAESSFINSLHLKPEYAAAHCNLSRSLLHQGKYEQGWLEHEWRWELYPQRKRKLNAPRWMGASLRKKTILLYAEDGASPGEVLQLIRYASQLKSQGARVVVECASSLTPVLKRCIGVDEVLATGGALPKVDFHAAILSLPAILRTSLRTIPSTVPYITADPVREDAWRPRIQGLAGLKVGILWQANGVSEASREKSIPLSHLQPLSQVGNVSLVSLQTGRGRQQLVEMAGKFDALDLIGESGSADRLDDVASIAKQLDLVITVDDVLAHLAGAMGLPTWLIVPYANDPCWLSERDDSPWYPMTRIYRQRRRGDWKGVLANVIEDLHAKVLELVPLEPDARRGGGDKGNSLHEEGRRKFNEGNLVGAIDFFKRAIEIDANRPLVHHDLGVVLAKQRQLRPAIEHFRRAIALDSSSHSAYSNLALALIEIKDYEGTVELLRQAIRKFPQSADLHCRLGIALSAMNLRGEAMTSLNAAVRFAPQYAEAHFALGNELKREGNLAHAVEAYRRAILLRPEWADAYHNLGLALAADARHGEAIDAYREAVRLRRDFTEAYNDLAISLADSDQLEAATEAFQHAAYLQPDNPETHKNLAMSLLLQGKYEQGWLEYEWRLRGKGNPKRRLPGRRWDGAPLVGKSLLLVAEQGVDNTLQFVRYAVLAKEQGAKVFLECQSTLCDFLACCPFLDRVIVQGQPLPASDFHCQLLSLPTRFHTTLDRVPSSVPYLAADSRLTSEWGKAFVNDKVARIGIAWRGSRKYADDRKKSIPLSAFRPLSMDAKLINLQKDFASDEMDAIDFPVHRLEGFEKPTTSFDDVAAIISHLDYLVTSDTAIAHLAGAMGKPVYLALATSCDWRWMRSRTDSPWYPTIRLVRQRHIGQWDDVFFEIAEMARRRHLSTLGLSQPA